MKKITLLFLFCILCIYSLHAVTQKGNSPLYNFSWSVGRINEVTVNPEYSMSIRFSNGEVWGTAYCNEFMGPFTEFGNNQISVGLLRLTRKVCEQRNLEDRFVELLQSADNYQSSGNILILRSGNEVLLEFYPEGTNCPWPYTEPEPEEPVFAGYEYHYDASGNRTLRETIYLINSQSAMTNTKSGIGNKKEDSQISDEHERPIERAIGSFDLKIYPNPTKGILKIDVAGDNDIQNALIEVYTVNGKTVYSSKDVRRNYQIDLSNQSNGVYIMRIVLNNIPYEWKIVKE